jgi:hypothetical protein
MSRFVGSDAAGLGTRREFVSAARTSSEFFDGCCETSLGEAKR